MSKFQKITIVLFVFTTFIIVFISYLSKRPNQSKVTNSPSSANNKTENSTKEKISAIHEKAILKVGSESIYEKDFETEWAYYPVHNEEAKKLLYEKMINESKLLQIAQKEGIILVDSTIYNSPSKDYFKRVKTIQEIKKILAKNAKGIRGTVVSIWFLNDHVGPLGYEKAKQIAWEKISSIHRAVKNKEISIREAGEKIRQDTSLAPLDPNYQINSSFNFDTSNGKKVTWEEDFNEALQKQPTGGLSDIYTGHSFDFDQKGKKVEAYYLFGQVSERVENTPITNLEDWVKEKSKKYEVVYY